MRSTCPDVDCLVAVCTARTTVRVGGAKHKQAALSFWHALSVIFGTIQHRMLPTNFPSSRLFFHVVAFRLSIIIVRPVVRWARVCFFISGRICGRICGRVSWRVDRFCRVSFGACGRIRWRVSWWISGRVSGRVSRFGTFISAIVSCTCARALLSPSGATIKVIFQVCTPPLFFPGTGTIWRITTAVPIVICTVVIVLDVASSG